MANRIPIRIDKGSTWTLTVIWEDPPGVRRTLTGYTARLEIRDSYIGEALITLTSAIQGGIRIEQDTIEGSSQGVIVLEIAGSLSRAVFQTKGVYDLLMQIDGVPTRLIEGSVTFRQAVTSSEV